MLNDYFSVKSLLEEFLTVDLTVNDDDSSKICVSVKVFFNGDLITQSHDCVLKEKETKEN